MSADRLAMRSASPTPSDVVVRSPSFRDDVQWLRAVAVLAVFAYHLDLPGFSGGYVGVDVFFVVSGYLISRLLLSEHERSGTIDLGRFARRRIRRLLPVSTLVLLTTLAWLWLGAGAVRRQAEALVARTAAVFAANVGLARLGTDYLTADQESVFQHYWSLGVEEQFYVLWPALLLAALTLGARSRLGPRRTVTGLIVGIGIASAVLAAVLTSRSQPLAFFLLPGRAWELLVGAAIAVHELRGRRPVARGALRLAGLAVIAATVTGWLGGGFPWPLALAPTLATAAVLWAGVDEPSSPPWARSRWMRWIGDRSYALYLWHWPPLVLLGLVDDRWYERPVARLLVVGGVSVATALTFRLVEEPLRRGRWLRTGWSSLAFLVAVVVGSLGAAYAVTGGSAPDAAPDEAIPLPLPDADHTGDRVPATGRLDEPLDVPDSIPEDIRASLPTVRKVTGEIYDNECHAPVERGAAPPTSDCTYGDPAGTPTVVLLGDSHAASWFGAGRAAADARGWRLVILTKSSCGMFDERAIIYETQTYEECLTWRSDTWSRLAELAPDVVIMAGAAEIHERAEPTTWLAGVRKGVATLRSIAPDAALVLPLDPPRDHDGRHIPTCLDELADIAGCWLTQDVAFDAAQRKLAHEIGDAVIDTPALVCRDGRCPPIIGDTLVYRDDDHLSLAMSQLLAPELIDAVDRARRCCARATADDSVE